jgi:Fe-S-cluster-containing dehydrogenase component
LRRRPDGVVEHLRDRCIGCAYCIKACPFGVPKRSPTQHTMRKCSFCIQRIDRGMEPACVAKCTNGALRYFGDGSKGGDLPAYGRSERLHMVYALEGRPEEFNLPEPVPSNTTTSHQTWKWLAGLLPGGVVLAWLWKWAGDQEKADE